MPSVQQTTLAKSIEENTVQYMKKLKEDCISSAYKELNESIVRCNIPSKDQLQPPNISA